MAKVWIDRRHWDEGDLPDVCVCCGEPTTERLHRNFSWMPGWIYFMLLIHLLIFLIVAMLNRQTWRAAIPVCRDHRNYWAWRTALLLLSFFGVFALGIFVGIAAASVADIDEDDAILLGMFGGMVALVGWIILVIVVQNNSVRVGEIKTRAICLKGVAPEFVAAYERIQKSPVSVDAELIEALEGPWHFPVSLAR